MSIEIALLAAGCFWCAEAVFEDFKGVKSVASGYAGGHVDRPTYAQVCEGSTGHAEAVRIEFDPDELTYDELLDIFFHIHDPTTLDRQGEDIGHQYRSAVFPLNEAQRSAAVAAIDAASAGWADPIVTAIEDSVSWWPAEDEHKRFFATNGESNRYCSTVVAPKLRQFRAKYQARLKSAAAS